MRTKKLVLILGLLVLGSTTAFADSPLTSTKIAKAYMDEPIVVVASQSNGVINDQIMAYLANRYNPLDVKIAVINQLGWKVSGKTNSTKYMEYLMKERNYSSEKKLYKKSSGDDLLTVAYLKALDDYFNVDGALKYAKRAVKKNKESRTTHLIAGLIQAQKTMDSDWCQVYQITDNVRKNLKLNNDMRTMGVREVYRYMDIYGSSCKKKA